MVSIMLVLFMLGLLGLILLHGKKLSDYVRENISVTVMMKDNISDDMILNFRQKLEKSGYVKSSKYITREQAAAELSKDLGEDFVKFLGYNPLPATVDVYLKSSYANSDSLVKIEKKIMASNLVREVVYQKSMVDEINSNIRNLGFILGGFSIILLIVAVILINNTIKLSIYSKRFLIRSMQLVGATQYFISKPFIVRSLIHGLISGVVAIGLLIAVLAYAQNRVPEIKQLQDTVQFAVFYGLIIILGVLLSGLSTFISVRRFLHMKTDYLYTN
jgi:cell division transport system permease protein